MCVGAELLKLFLTICDSMDCSPKCSTVHRILKARILEYCVGCLVLLQGIFLTQGSNPSLLRLLRWQADSLPLTPPGKPYNRMKVLLAQSCLTLCNPMKCSLPGSSIHGILQVRILVWVAMPFSRGSSWPMNRTLVSCIAGRFHNWATRESCIRIYSCYSVTQSRMTLCDPMDCSMLDFPVFQHYLELEMNESPLNLSHPLSQWYYPIISSSVVPFSCLQSSPAPGSCPISQLSTSGGQNFGPSALASVLPMNMQRSSSLVLIGLISFKSKWLLRVFSNTTVQKHQFIGAL